MGSCIQVAAFCPEQVQEKQKGEGKFEPTQQETTNLEKETTDSEYTRIKTKDLNKIKRAQQEIVEWHGEALLGLKPNLWLEILDKEHRQGSFLHPYWQRWEKSHTDLDFFEWLDNGPGRFMDLPEKPRRMLEEGKILYLKSEQQQFFKVIIKDGFFFWDNGGTPVTVPGSKGTSKRQKAIDILLKDKIETMETRDGALHALKDIVEKHRRDPELKKVRPDLKKICKDEDLDLTGLLWQLRDEYFQERRDPPRKEISRAGESKYDNQKDFRKSAEFLEKLENPFTWDEIYEAVMHDLGESQAKKDKKQEKRKEEGKQGKEKKEGEKKEKGIFVVDKYDNIYCYNKVRGIIQHSSFVRGHSVKFAGGLTISDGKLIEIRPHSGHYRPDPESLNKLREAWITKDVNWKEVVEKPFEKED